MSPCYYDNNIYIELIHYYIYLWHHIIVEHHGDAADFLIADSDVEKHFGSPDGAAHLCGDIVDGTVVCCGACSREEIFDEIHSVRVCLLFSVCCIDQLKHSRLKQRKRGIEQSQEVFVSETGWYTGCVRHTDQDIQFICTCSYKWTDRSVSAEGVVESSKITSSHLGTF